MVEFAIASAVLALLMLGMPLVARLHELQLTGIEATRVAAFVDSWGYRDTVAASQWSERLFTDGDARGQAQLGAIRLQYSRGAPPGVAATTGQLLLAPFKPLRLVGGGFDLVNAGQHRAQLAAAVVWPDSVPQPFAGLDLSFDEHYELLGEQWGGAGPSQVAKRVSGLLVPPGAQALSPLLGLAAAALSVVEPAWRHFCIGAVNPEIVPSDRLRTSAAGVPPIGTRTRWRAPC